MGLQMGPTHPAGFVTVSKRPLQQFTPLPKQSLASHTAKPTTVGVHRFSLRRPVLRNCPARDICSVVAGVG